MRILVPQLLQRESAPLRDGHRLLEQLAWIKLRESLPLAQITLAIGIELPAGFPDRHVVPDRRDRILQPAASAYVHVDIAARHQRQREFPAYPLQRLEPLPIHPVAKQFDRYPQPVREAFLEPARLLRRCPLRQPENETVLEPILLQVRPCQGVLALLRDAPTAGDDPAEPPVAAPVGGEHHELHPTGETQLRANDELQPLPFRRHVGTHDTSDRALIRNRKRLVPQLNRLLHHLVRMRSSAQESEVRQAVKLGIRNLTRPAQPNTP